jgi:ubiquinone biosynthesis protein COQ4
MENATSQHVSLPRFPTLQHLQLDPRRGFNAARVIASDPDDLPQVFTIIEAFSCDTLFRTGARMLRSETGRQLLADRPDIVELLADRAALARLPEGSLGRAYLAFVEREKISAEGIREAADKGMEQVSKLPAPLDWVHARLRDTHDLWHAATGYSGDVLGESALLAFSLAQTWNPGIALIIMISLIKMRELKAAGGVDIQQTIFDGFRRGKKAAWLPGQEWESMLALPVEEVRKRLNLEAPPVYREVRSSEIKAAVAAAA